MPNPYGPGPSPFELRVSVAEKLRHPMSNTDNPFCPRCGLRTFPLWERPHDCSQSADVARVRHLAGDFLSNLHFYRVPAEVQLAALAQALGFALGDYVVPGKLEPKLNGILEWVKGQARAQNLRVANNRQAANIVMDVNRPRLRVKKGGKKHDVERVQVPSRKRSAVKRRRSR